MKLAEADFFLDRMKDAAPLGEINFYFSAFVTAARSVSFALQAVMKGIPDFEPWYEARREELARHPLSRFFVEYRNEVQKTGEWAITGGSMVGGVVCHVFSKPLPGDVGSSDALAVCAEYMRLIVGLVHRCYVDHGPRIDPDQYYTLANLRHLGLTVEDAEEQLGFPCGWTAVTGAFDEQEDRIRALRSAAGRGSEVGWIFEKYGVGSLPVPPPS